MASPIPNYAALAPQVEKRYKALRFVGTVYKVLGIIVMVLTALISIGICGFSAISGSALDSLRNSIGQSTGVLGLFSGLLGGIISGLIILLYGALMGITTYAIGQFIYLFIDIEENTRITAELLQHRSG
jgi:hypothetical protein